MFYGNGSDIKKPAEKIDIEKTDGNSLMAKAMALKVYQWWLYRYKFNDKVPRQTLLRQKFEC